MLGDMAKPMKTGKVELRLQEEERNSFHWLAAHTGQQICRQPHMPIRSEDVGRTSNHTVFVVSSDTPDNGQQIDVLIGVECETYEHIRVNRTLEAV